MSKTLPPAWKEVVLGDVAEVQKGTSFTSKELVPGDVPVIAGGRQPAYYHKYANRKAETITVSGSGAHAGYVAIHDIPIFATDCTTIRSFSNVSLTRYVYYYLKSRQEDLYRRRNGSAQPHVYPRDLINFNIVVPPLQEQQLIVDTLGSIDEAIEQTENIIIKTEQLCDALLHKLLTRGLPGGHTEWKEVPGLGTIPATWQVARLGEVAQFVNGRAFRPSDWTNYGLPIVRIQNLTDPEAQFNFFNGKVNLNNLINNGDIIISWSATLKVWTWHRNTAILNQHIFKVLPDPARVEYRFLFYLLVFMLDSLRKQVHGTTMKHITKSNFDSTRVPIPPLSDQYAIALILDKVNDAVRKWKIECDMLKDFGHSTTNLLLAGSRNQK